MGASRFFFDSFQVDIPHGSIVYKYRTDAGHAFSHELTFAFPEGSTEAALAPAAFALGMAELIHYWKAILAPEIVVSAGALSDEQILFWEKLYRHGLGEFFYENKIDFRGVVRVVRAPDAPVISATLSTGTGVLVPFGGGKDSLVTGELLKRAGKSFSWFELEPLPFATALKEVSGVTGSVTMGRDVGKNFAPVVALVASGAPNGHVPITATYMLSAVFAAKASGYRDVVMSIERSASEGNVEYLGMEVNHQYSKSFEFEQALHAYVTNYIDPHIRLFSLLRPHYEMQIVREFIQHPQYFSHFVSCNRGLKSGTWCGTCAKCAFMFAALSAFLPPETVESIFKKNLYEDESLVPLYRDLVGLGTAKPFDCVGTFDENLLALYLSGQQYARVQRTLPFVLTHLPIYQGETYLPLLQSTTTEHLVPEDYLV